MCCPVFDRDTVFLRDCLTSQTPSEPQTRASFSIFIYLSLPNDFSLQLRVWPEWVTCNSWSICTKMPVWRWPLSGLPWRPQGQAGPGWRPGSPRGQISPLTTHCFSPKPGKETLTQNEPGDRFSREGTGRVNGTMVQMTWKEQGWDPAGPPCELDGSLQSCLCFLYCPCEFSTCKVLWEKAKLSPC